MRLSFHFRSAFTALLVAGALAALPCAGQDARSAQPGTRTHPKHGTSLHSAGATATPGSGDTPAAADHKPESVYDFGLPTADGKNLSLGQYKGKVLLLVNLARQSSYNAQLAALQKLNATFADKGLVVIGVPSNDFGNAEPGTPADVARFYADQKLTFPVMQVSTLTGVHELPLFTFLTGTKGIANDGLHWNYTKFLIDRKGKLVACFPPEIAPDSLDVLATVQEVVDGTWKPRKSPEHNEEAAADDDDL